MQDTEKVKGTDSGVEGGRENLTEEAACEQGRVSKQQLTQQKGEGKGQVERVGRAGSQTDKHQILRNCK